MKLSHIKSHHVGRRLPFVQVMTGVAVLVLISSALVAGKYLLQGDADTRSQASGRAVCADFTSSWYPDSCGVDKDHCQKIVTECATEEEILFIGAESQWNPVNLPSGVSPATAAKEHYQRVYSRDRQPCNITASVTGTVVNPAHAGSLVLTILTAQGKLVTCGNSTIACVNGTQVGALGPATITHPDGSVDTVPAQDGCKPTGTTGGSSTGSGSGTTNVNCASNLEMGQCLSTPGVCDWHTCNSIPESPVHNVCVPKGVNPCVNPVATQAQMCGQTCHNQPTGFCKGLSCINGVCHSPEVCGGGGGSGTQCGSICNEATGRFCFDGFSCVNGSCWKSSCPTAGTGGGSGTTPLSSRTIIGQIKCTNVVGMAAPLNQPYVIANVPVRTFGGGSAVPTTVIGSATTNAQGIYSMGLNTQQTKFTVRVSNNNQDHDYSFYRKKPSSLSGVTCYDNNAFELCDYLNIAAGTTKAGFDFETNVRAENLRGYQSGSSYVFEFKQAKDYTNKVINRYVVRLDNKADGWYLAASDYYLTVPKSGTSGVGTCSGGICKITSAELNAIKTFKFGTYGMGVNPISNAQAANQTPVIELCRNDATIQAQVSQTGTSPVPVTQCAANTGECRLASQGTVIGATKCKSTVATINGSGSTIEQYCCPTTGQRILGGRCITIGLVQITQ